MGHILNVFAEIPTAVLYCEHTGANTKMFYAHLADLCQGTEFPLSISQGDALTRSAEFRELHEINFNIALRALKNAGHVTVKDGWIYLEATRAGVSKVTETIWAD